MLARSFPAPSNGRQPSGLAIAGANPDYRMTSVPIDPTGRYVVDVTLNGAERMGLGCYTPTPQAGLQLDGYVNLGDVEIDPGGGFSVSIEPSDRRNLDNAGGDLLIMSATSRVLIIRELHKIETTTPARIDVERLDRPASPLTAPLGDMFARAAERVQATLRQYLRWTELFTEAPNAMRQMHQELDDAVNGDPDTRYYSGGFVLEADQVLEITIPDIACDYWMIQANTHWLEPLAGAHVNDATAVRDSDGVIRVRVATGPTSQPNTLDSGGRARSTLLYRTVDANETVVPMVEVRG